MLAFHFFSSCLNGRRPCVSPTCKESLRPVGKIKFQENKQVCATHSENKLILHRLGRRRIFREFEIQLPAPPTVQHPPLPFPKVNLDSFLTGKLISIGTNFDVPLAGRGGINFFVSHLETSFTGGERKRVRETFQYVRKAETLLWPLGNFGSSNVGLSERDFG